MICDETTFLGLHAKGAIGREKEKVRVNASGTGMDGEDHSSFSSLSKLQFTAMYVPHGYAQIHTKKA